MLRDYLQKNILITDGAMGTYYSQITGKDTTLSEYANINEPDVVKNIHEQYVNAGAKLIRTNTFSVNRYTLNAERQDVRLLIEKGYEIAKQAVEDREVYIAADIGPVPEGWGGKDDIDDQSILDEYRYIVDVFLASGAQIFVFETFNSTKFLDDISAYIKNRDKSSFIITQFAVGPSGYTRKEKSIAGLMQEVRKIPNIDAYGFNCGAGPTHLHTNLKQLDLGCDIVSVLPNAGYPEIVNERTIYSHNADYFSDVMMHIKALGVKILGGCCGTTPVHIQKIAEKISGAGSEDKPVISKASINIRTGAVRKKSVFAQKLGEGKFTVAVELDPPCGSNIDKIVDGAKVLKNSGVDIITISDSPLARVRNDSIMVSAKIIREAGIDAMPHISCRDKNIIAIKSGILAGYSEGIRNLLAITGDPIASAERSEIKSVFNLNSSTLMELISRMNEEFFSDDMCNIGGALNLNVLNREKEVARMFRKMNSGAGFFMTQPVYEDGVIDFISGMDKGKAKILAGIMPAVSYRNAQFLNNEIPGIRIPQAYIDSFHPKMTREEAEEAGIHMAVNIALKLKQHVDGFYFMTPFNRVDMMVKILKKVL